MHASRFLLVLSASARRVALAVGATIVVPSIVASQSAPTSVIIVGVADAETGEALTGTQVILPAWSRAAQTDGLGEARFVGIPSGTHRIRIRRLGYAAVDTSLTFVGDTTGAVFRLHRTPVAIEALAVKAPASQNMRDFEMRRTIGTGRYLTAEQLEKDASRPFGLVAMTRFPGLRLVNGPDGRPHIASVRGSCGAGVSPSESILERARAGGSGGRGATAGGSPTSADGSGGAGSGSSGGSGNGSGVGATRTSFGSCTPSKECYVITFLDNLQLDSADFDLITTWDIAGVEYYTGNSVPPRYRVSGAACGVLLVWSK